MLTFIFCRSGNLVPLRIKKPKNLMPPQEVHEANDTLSDIRPLENSPSCDSNASQTPSPLDIGHIEVSQPCDSKSSQTHAPLDMGHPEVSPPCDVKPLPTPLAHEIKPVATPSVSHDQKQDSHCKEHFLPFVDILLCKTTLNTWVKRWIIHILYVFANRSILLEGKCPG